MPDLEQHEKLVLAFIDLAFNDKRPVDAFAAFVADDYVQHNPHAPNGVASARFLAEFLSGVPQLRIEVRRVVAAGEMVVTHSLITPSPGAASSAAADFFRVRDGRIVEHWDVVQEVPAATASGNAMV